jgi:hypothetical protein
LAVFPRCSLDPYEFRYGRFARAVKNSQLSPGESHVIYGTGHKNGRDLPAGLALEDKFINVTLKKSVDWVELKQNPSQVSNRSTGAGTGV